MSKSHKTKLKRHLAQGLHSLENVNWHLESVRLEFVPSHEDYAEYLEMMQKSLAELRDHVLKFWELAWGKRPNDPKAWR